jgi:hypothetical protein
VICRGPTGLPVIESPNAMILTVDCRLAASTEAAVATEQIATSAVKPEKKYMVRKPMMSVLEKRIYARRKGLSGQILILVDLGHTVYHGIAS